MKPNQHTCSECQKPRERCRIAAVTSTGECVYVCRACWTALAYDEVMYEHRTGVKC